MNVKVDRHGTEQKRSSQPSKRVPSTDPTTPSGEPSAPSTDSTTAPPGKPSAPSTDPAAPSGKPSAPSTDPAAPSGKPSAPSGKPPLSSQAPAQAPSNTRPPIVFGVTVLLVTFGIFGLWAATAPIGSGAVASGMVAVESNRKEVQHLEGGIIEALLVRNGDMVQANQVMIRLDRTKPLANVQIVQSQLDLAMALEARLIAEQQNKDVIVFPKVLADRQHEPSVKENLDGQQELLADRKKFRLSQIAILEQRVLQLKDQLVGLMAQVTSKQSQVVLLQEEIDGQTQLLDKGHASKVRYLALLRGKLSLEGEIGQLQSDISGTEVRIGETKLQIIQTNQKFREEVTAQRQEIQQKVFDLRERHFATRDVLNRIDIRAPTSGVVMDMAVDTIGGVIAPGVRLLDIVPQDDRLIIEASVSPIDIERVTIGTQAEIRFLPFSQRMLPVMFGSVIAISADVLMHERTGTSYYSARVEVSESELAKLDGQFLIPGMPADVIFQAGERTMLQYLVSPLTDAFARSFKE